MKEKLTSMFKRTSRSLLPVMLIAAAVPIAAAAQQSVSALKNHDSSQPIEISADRLEVRSRDDVAVFEGRVEAVQEDLTLRADRVTVYYDRKPEGAGEGDAPPISRIDAAGKVTLISPSENVSANWGVYDMTQRIVTLGGSVVLNRGDVTVRGDRLQVNLDSGVTRLETASVGTGDVQEKGRVRGRFTPSDRASEDPDAPR